jgi:hypothetical protein
MKTLLKSIGIWGLICLFILVIVWLAASKIGKQLGDVSEAFGAIASFCNIGLVIYFFLKDRSIRDKEEKYKINNYWFRSIALEKNIGLLHDFFTRNYEIIDNCKRLNESTGITKQEYDRLFKEQLGPYTDCKMNVRKLFTDIVRILSKEFGQAIDDLFIEFQDEFNAALLKLSVSNNEETYLKCKDLVSEQRRKLFQKIYSFEINNCTNNENFEQKKWKFNTVFQRGINSSPK